MNSRSRSSNHAEKWWWYYNLLDSDLRKHTQVNVVATILTTSSKVLTPEN